MLVKVVSPVEKSIKPLESALGKEIASLKSENLEICAETTSEN